MDNAHFSDTHVREPVGCTTAVWDFRVTSAYKTAIFLQKYCFCQRKLHQSPELFPHEVIKNNVSGCDWLRNPPHVLLNHLRNMSFHNTTHGKLEFKSLQSQNMDLLVFWSETA